MKYLSIKNNFKEILKQNKYIYKFVRSVKKGISYIRSVPFEVIKFYICFYLKKMGIKRIDPYIDSLKDLYTGQKIFIVATGPSLTLEDLELLKEHNAITISINGIFNTFDKTSWRPDYYIMDDYWVFDIYKKKYPDVNLYNIGIKGTVFVDKAKERIPYKPDNNHTGFVKVCYYDHWWTHYSKKYNYNRDIRYGVFDFYTVTNSAITLADYMGAKEIYLLGVDCNYSSSIKHVGEQESKMSDDDIKNALDTENGMIMGYKKIKEFIGDKVCIYNATRGGKLEVFPRKSLEEALD